MDTKTLMVGREVILASGIYSKLGKVVKVTADGVEVQTLDELLQFDNAGKGHDEDGTPECGPYYIQPPQV
jgi:hypothetical protein